MTEGTFESRTIAVTFALDSKRLLFGAVPAENVVEEPPGSTDPQTNNIEHIATGRCSQLAIAVTADGNHIHLWPVGIPQTNVAPTSIDTGGAVLAIATRDYGSRFVIAALLGDQILIYLIPNLNAVPSEPSVVVEVVDPPIADPPPKLVLTEDEQRVVVGLGGSKADSSGLLKTWQLPISATGDVVPSESVRQIWKETALTQPVISLAAGSTAGSPQFLVGQGATAVESLRFWLPDRMVRIRSKTALELSPQVSLPVDFGPDILPDDDSIGRVTPARVTRLGLVRGLITRWAYLRLVQGNSRCLTLDPTTADARRGDETTLRRSRGQPGSGF